MVPQFADSAEVFAWFYQFINLGQGQSRRSFRLDRMKHLAAMAGNPERCVPAIHIAGSKGKGSVTAMIASILEASGLKTARYSSPFVSDNRERVSLGKGWFPEKIYISAAEELAALLEKIPSSPPDIKRLFDSNDEEGEEPSFFELLTLYFFLCVRKEGCDAMVVETGMGGRLDATNILDPLVSVITLIEKEHTEYLGSSIAFIAAEKGGIIKPEKPLVLAGETPEAFEVFASIAEDMKAPLYYFPRLVSVNDCSIRKTGTGCTLAFSDPSFFPEPLKINIPIPGKVQAENAGLAVLAVKLAFPSIGPEDIQRGLSSVFLPGRFEKIRENPELVIDGAHTKKSMEYCCQTFAELYGRGGILLFGCAMGKDAASMADTAVLYFSHIIITNPGSFKKSKPGEIYDIFSARAAEGQELLLIEETEKAIEYALSLGMKKKLPVLGAGSFYLAGEIRKYDDKVQ
ncbi:MAG: bifunctional folylpolyglutamate synthase/dihydrofolate synthase [Treponema sp.]|jgi:dihydrofolate synthase/folylpolyglutamate synthase|nr:bifunctional folylpolyglutamate synthase/dihydrofolate synthase [Treponema sp.]